MKIAVDINNIDFNKTLNKKKKNNNPIEKNKIGFGNNNKNSDSLEFQEKKSKKDTPTGLYTAIPVVGSLVLGAAIGFNRILKNKTKNNFEQAKDSIKSVLNEQKTKSALNEGKTK